MSIEIRPVTLADSAACGSILYEAFRKVDEYHRFRSKIPSVKFATDFIVSLIHHPGIYGTVAVQDGEILGSNFMTEFDSIYGIGPLTVHPDYQGHGIGKQLMHDALERSRYAEGVRLMQDAYNTTSLSLYMTLGFDLKETAVLLEGTIDDDMPEGYSVRPWQPDDMAACGELHCEVHGFAREQELGFAAQMFHPVVALHQDEIVAYAAAPHFWALNHGVARDLEAMQALLIGISQDSEEPLQLLLASRQAELFRWALAKGLKVIKTMNLMSKGKYQEPEGYYLLSSNY